jgi:hypothetical protein
LAVLGVVVVGGMVFWLSRRGRRSGSQSFAEACCPACLALAALSQREALVADLG